MCAKFGYGPTVVSKKKGGGYRQTDKGTLQLYIVDNEGRQYLTGKIYFTPNRVIKVPHNAAAGGQQRRPALRGQRACPNVVPQIPLSRGLPASLILDHTQ